MLFMNVLINERIICVCWVDTIELSITYDLSFMVDALYHSLSITVSHKTCEHLSVDIWKFWEGQSVFQLDAKQVRLKSMFFINEHPIASIHLSKYLCKTCQKLRKHLTTRPRNLLTKHWSKCLQYLSDKLSLNLRPFLSKRSSEQWSDHSCRDQSILPLMYKVITLSVCV